VDSNQKPNELTQLRHKIDTLVLEKNSYKVKNDELMRDLETITKNLESLRKINKEFKEINHKSTQTNQLNKLISTLAQTDFNFKLVARTSSSHSQTDPAVHKEAPPPPIPPVKPPHAVPTTAQTPTKPKLTTSTLTVTENCVASTEAILKSDDLDYEQLRKEKIELEIKVNELTNEKYLNIKLKNELSELTKEIEAERKEYEQKINKLISDFNISKQVSDTIIQQQKKLLHYLQMKMGGKVAELDENVPSSGGSAGSNGNSGKDSGHNIRNLFKNKVILWFFLGNFGSLRPIQRLPLPMWQASLGTPSPWYIIISSSLNRFLN
jgi:hypothetical protein